MYGVMQILSEPPASSAWTRRSLPCQNKFANHPPATYLEGLNIKWLMKKSWTPKTCPNFIPRHHRPRPAEAGSQNTRCLGQTATCTSARPRQSGSTPAPRRNTTACLTCALTTPTLSARTTSTSVDRGGPALAGRRADRRHLLRFGLLRQVLRVRRQAD